MNSKLLRYVVTVAEMRSFSNAAKRLFLSQPSLSQSIIALEKDLGTPLFDRSTVPLSLTFAGEKFVKAAKQILLIEHELSMQISDIADQRSGVLSIGVPLSCGSALIAQAFPLFQSIYPEVKLTLVETAHDRLSDMALSGELDLVLLSDEIPAGLAGIPLHTDRLLLAVGPGYWVKRDFSASIDYPRIGLHAFRSIPFVLLTPGTLLRKATNIILNDYEFTPKVAVETQSMDLVVKLVSTSPVAAVILESCLNTLETPPRCYRLDQREYACTLYICHRRNLYLTNIMKAFIQLVQEVSATALPTMLAVGETMPLPG